MGSQIERGEVDAPVPAGEDLEIRDNRTYHVVSGRDIRALQATMNLRCQTTADTRLLLRRRVARANLRPTSAQRFRKLPADRAADARVARRQCHCRRRDTGNAPPDRWSPVASGQALDHFA
jgi:hypothetical protein